MTTTSTNLTATQVRQQFIDFFCQRADHTFVPSSPVVPHDDPTLLFINAGMNQFKPVFLDQVPPGSPLAGLKRAANSQKCIRAGGKHNDLDDVGRDTYHHTFFEMLGNWSFGDYFKAESIKWAWELLTEVWGLDPERLYATYFEGDKSLGVDPDREAYDLWCRYLPPERILPGNLKDNFWEMGDTGPCGPCSEIHYDGRSEQERARVPGYQLVNRESPDVIEIWNLVFIQFNRTERSLDPLPAKHVDTGMGLERIVRVLQGRTSNYDTDIFTPLFEKIREVCEAPAYTGSLTSQTDTAYRVIADHVRTLTVAITDGAEPSNEGRGYVLRRILRRAVRYGRQTLGTPGPFLCDLVSTVVQNLGPAFPELREHEERVTGIIREEEEAFGRTLDHGLALFDRAASNGRTISAEDAFRLHDTYGFPIDLTQVMAEEQGVGVDVEGFERLMEEARERSRAGAGAGGDRLSLTATAIGDLKRLGVRETDDGAKFELRQIRASVRAIWNGDDFDENLVAANTRPSQRFAIVLDKTSFYAEMGGQVADTGRITVERGAQSGSEFVVEDVRAFGGYIAHIGTIRKGELRVGDTVRLRVDPKRRQEIAANHTATHLLNKALRDVLGEGVDQKGSLVAPDRLRFDFSHGSGLAAEQMRSIEQAVATDIKADLVVHAAPAPLGTARQINGVRAVFGETYPDPVRVVSIGKPVEELLARPEDPEWRKYSVEFCGGTHLGRTGEAGAFALVSEEAVSRGVRRVIGLSGEQAEAAHNAADRLASRIEGASTLDDRHLGEEVRQIEKALESATLPAARRAELGKAIQPLLERVKKAQKAAAGAGRDRAVEQARSIATSQEGPVIVDRIEAGNDRQAVLAALDTLRSHHAHASIMLFSGDEAEQKVTVVASVPQEHIDMGLKAGDWVRAASEVVGGKGGGRPDSAQGGGTDPARINDAIERAREFASALTAG